MRHEVFCYFSVKGVPVPIRVTLKSTTIILCVLYTVAGLICDHVKTYCMQDGRTPLMVAAGAGHLLMAMVLLVKHRSNVHEEDNKVSG